MKIALLSAILLIPLIGRAGELEKLYDSSHSERQEASKNSRPWDEANPGEHEFTEVGLERPPWVCLDCPVYTVIIKADGRFTYTGESNVPHLGQHTGKIGANVATALFQFIREMEYFSLDDYYSPAPPLSAPNRERIISFSVTDQDTVYTMVAKADQRKVVKNYGGAAPLKLWALEQLIDALFTTAHWDNDK